MKLAAVPETVAEKIRCLIQSLADVQAVDGVILPGPKKVAILKRQ